jgi:hypothetical protein
VLCGLHPGSEELQRVTLPVEVCAGTLDSLIPEANLRELAAALPNSSFTVFPNRGHLDFTIGQDEDVVNHTLAVVGKHFAAPVSEPALPHALPGVPLMRPRDAQLQHPFLNAYTNAEVVLEALTGLYNTGHGGARGAGAAPSTAVSTDSNAPAKAEGTQDAGVRAGAGWRLGQRAVGWLAHAPEQVVSLLQRVQARVDALRGEVGVSFTI